MNRKKKSKDLGTDPPGRSGTNRPPTTSTDESIKQNGADAYGHVRLLPGRENLLRTDRCSNNREMMQFDRTHGNGTGRMSSIPGEEYPRELYDDEDVSLPPSVGHCSDYMTEPSPSQMTEDTFPPNEESTAYVACADSDEQPAVLHECLAVTAMNPASKTSCRAVLMFDSGSSSSHVSSKLAHFLNLPQREVRVRNVSTFGSKAPLALNGFRTFLVLCSEHGRSLQRWSETAISLRCEETTAHQLRLERCPTGCPTIIGQDLAHLFDRQLEPTLPCGTYIVQTSLRPTIGGAARSVTTPPKALPSSSPPAGLPAAEDADVAENSSRLSLSLPPLHSDPATGRLHLRPRELSACSSANLEGSIADSSPQQPAYPPTNLVGDTAVCDIIEVLVSSTATTFVSRQAPALPRVRGLLPQSAQKQLFTTPLDAQLLLLPTYSTTFVEVEEVSATNLCRQATETDPGSLSSLEAEPQRSIPSLPTHGDTIHAALCEAGSNLEKKTRLRPRLPDLVLQPLGIYTAPESVTAVTSLPASNSTFVNLLRAEREQLLMLMPRSDVTH